MGSLVVTECKKETERIHTLDIDRIIPNKDQPRRYFDDMGIVSLADSIHRYGILQPISVRRTEKGFIIIAGERRYRAAKMLNMRQIPCIILNTDEATSAIISIIENLQREDLNMFEEAMAILSLKEIYGMTQESVARTLSVSQSYVANKLRLLKFTDEEQCLILEHGLSERHCRAALRVEEKKREILEYIINNRLNVSASESYADQLNEKKKHPRIIDNRLKDLRVFYNSIDKAVNTVKRLGVDVETETADNNGERLLTIRIKN